MNAEQLAIKNRLKKILMDNRILSPGNNFMSNNTPYFLLSDMENAMLEYAKDKTVSKESVLQKYGILSPNNSILCPGGTYFLVSDLLKALGDM